MEDLPPVGWADVATKQDLGALRRDFDLLRQQFNGLGQQFDLKLGTLEHRMLTALPQEIGELRGELHQEIGGLGQEIGGLRGELHREISGLKGELVTQTRLYVFSMVGSLATIASIAFAAARLV